MRIVFLTGIWPPDVGGPATHGPDFARFLRDRGHAVRVVTMGDSEPTERPVPVESVARGRPFVVRYPLVAATGFRLARRADVVYATATYAAAAAAAIAPAARRQARLATRPTSARGATASSPARSRSSSGRRARRSRRCKRLRDRSLGRAGAIVVPSRVPRRRRGRLGPRPRAGRGARQPGAAAARRRSPSRSGPARFVFVGRLTEQKALPVAARRRCARVAGGEADRSSATAPERGRSSSACRELGLDDARTVPRLAAARRGAPLPRRRAARPCSRAPGRTCRMPRSRRSRSARPSSRRRSAACPRSCTTTRTGCSCRRTTPLRSPRRFARVLDDDELRDRLAAGAQPSVAAIGREPIYTRLEAILAEAAR